VYGMEEQASAYVHWKGIQKASSVLTTIRTCWRVGVSMHSQSVEFQNWRRVHTPRSFGLGKLGAAVGFGIHNYIACSFVEYVYV